MLFLVEDALFALPDESLLLTTLVGLCILHEHRLYVTPGPQQAFDAWLQGRTLREQDAVQDLLAGTSLREATGPALRRVRVSAGGADRDAPSPRLPPREAIELASRPFGIFLEGQTGDRVFLLACATIDQRRRLEEMEAQGLLEFVNGGGVPNMRRELNKLAPPMRLLRWALFDSDALVPGEPSRASAEVKAICARRGVKFHQLTRRTIENYLPEKAIDWWAGQGTGDLEQRAARGETRKAWRALSPPQRAHYGMKHGFGRDKQVFESLGDTQKEAYRRFWAGEERKNELARGFGGDAAGLFEAGPKAGVTADVLQGDEGIKTMMRELLEWLR